MGTLDSFYKVLQRRPVGRADVFRQTINNTLSPQAAGVFLPALYPLYRQISHYPDFGAGICRDTASTMPISANWMRSAEPP